MIKSTQSKLSLETGVLKGFTLIELMVVIGVLGILYAVTLWAINPQNVKSRARDVVRISDLGKLQSAIENYVSDNGVPPEIDNLLRRSDTSASPSASPNLANGNGWLGTDLSKYLEKLPTDPVNTSPNIYRYKRQGKTYELDAQLEVNSGLMLSTGKDGDGGNSDSHYEKGTNLDILGD